MSTKYDDGEVLDPKTGEPFRLAHAIDRDVWDARYLEYVPKGKVVPGAVGASETRKLFLESLTGSPARNQSADITKQTNWADKVGCIIIRRFPMPGADPITPELRHWEPMLGQPTIHYHGEDSNPCPINPETGKPLDEMQIASARRTDGEYSGHIRGKRNQAAYWRYDESSLRPDKMGWVLEKPHKGVNTNEVHRHPEFQKYRFLCKAAERNDRQHTHEHMLRIYVEHDSNCPGKPTVARNGRQISDVAVWDLCECTPRFRTKVWDAELKKRVSRLFDTLAEVAAHAPAPLKRFEPHILKRHAEDEPIPPPLDLLARPHLLILTKHKKEAIADRIDVHPLALPLFEGAKRAFFVIEGCIKADAMLSRDREPVFSVPSVTLWFGVPEFDHFASQYLTDKLVVIVADADWYENSMVLTHALLCRSALRKLGVRAHIAAPPKPVLDPERKGVDDFYADFPNVTADDLVVLDRHTKKGTLQLLYNELERWAKGHERSDKVESLTATLAGLALHAGIRKDKDQPEGQYCGSITPLARILDRDPKTVRSAVKELAARGSVEIVAGSLDTSEGSRKGSYWSSELDWDDPPTIRVVPQFRAETVELGTLREAEARWANDEDEGGSKSVVVSINRNEHAKAIIALGSSLGKAVERTGVSLETAKKISSKMTERLPEGMAFPWRGGKAFIYSNRWGPSVFRFQAERGKRLLVGLSNDGPLVATCRVLGPRDGATLWETDDLAPEEGVSVWIEPRYSGEHRVTFETPGSAAQTIYGQVSPESSIGVYERSEGGFMLDHLLEAPLVSTV